MITNNSFSLHWSVTVQILFAALIANSGCQNRSDSTEAPLPQSNSSQTQPAPHEDYADFRIRFRTTLTRKGPSPQQAAPLSVPAGASKLAYTSDEHSLTAFMALPLGVTEDATKKVPAVVFLHGGFAFGGGDWEMVTPYLDAGFAVMVPILRGENFQPSDFTLYYDEVEDVLAATEEFSKQPQIDAERIFVAGHSAGGTLATLSSMASDRFRAIASFSGMMDARSENKPPLLVFDVSDAEELLARSAVLFPGSFKSPARLYYGQQELWAVTETRKTAADAQMHGLDVTAVVVPGDHFSSVPAAMQDSIEFFRSKL